MAEKVSVAFGLFDWLLLFNWTRAVRFFAVTIGWIGVSRQKEMSVWSKWRSSERSNRHFDLHPPSISTTNGFLYDARPVTSQKPLDRSLDQVLSCDIRDMGSCPGTAYRFQPVQTRCQLSFLGLDNFLLLPERRPSWSSLFLLQRHHEIISFKSWVHPRRKRSAILAAVFTNLRLVSLLLSCHRLQLSHRLSKAFFP